VAALLGLGVLQKNEMSSETILSAIKGLYRRYRAYIGVIGSVSVLWGLYR
jgi:hypothetical protein